MLNPNLNIEALQSEYAEDHRLCIGEFLDSKTAEDVLMALQSLPFSYQFFSNGNRVASEAQMAALSPEQRQQLQNELITLAGKGVGFLYGGYHMEHQNISNAPTVLRQVFELMSGDTVRNLIRRITSRVDLNGATGQYTRYSRGHYLTRHTDNIVEERRRLAYVLNLTPTWHPDWGGLLQFFEPDGTPRDAWLPGFNRLALFDVRHIHSVTYVAPHAMGHRYALTGWFVG